MARFVGRVVSALRILTKRLVRVGQTLGRALTRFAQVSIPRRINTPVLWKTTAIAIALGGVLVVSRTLPEPSTLFVLNAQSESVEIQVLNAAAAQVSLEAALLEGDTRCIENIKIEVETGDTLIYARQTDGPLYISIRGPFYWSESQGGHKGDVRRRFLIGARGRKLNPRDCQWPRWIRLPANGIVTTGLVQSVPQRADDLLLLQGDLQLFNRSIDRLWGRDLNFRPFAANALYLASTFSIPPGSCVERALDRSGHLAEWAGTVTADTKVDGDTPALGVHIAIAANAQSVNLLAPAISESAHTAGAPADASAGLRADVIALSLGSRLLTDPNLRWIYGLLGVLTGTVVFFVQLWSK